MRELTLGEISVVTGAAAKPSEVAHVIAVGAGAVAAGCTMTGNVPCGAVAGAVAAVSELGSIIYQYSGNLSGSYYSPSNYQYYNTSSDSDYC